MNDEPQSNIWLTLKDYGFPTGVSTHVYKTDDKLRFTVKGPMGKGMQLGLNGTYVAFTGGTGALVFLDLVARLILSNLKLLPEAERFHPDFKFHFYASFKSEETNIGVNLCQKLLELNEKLGLSNFKFTLRLAEGSHVTNG